MRSVLDLRIRKKAIEVKDINFVIGAPWNHPGCWYRVAVAAAGVLVILLLLVGCV